VAKLNDNLSGHPDSPDADAPGFAARVPDDFAARVAVRGSVENCRMVDLPRISDPRGNLTFIEGGRHVPFAIERVYYTYDVPGGAERGGHAHRDLAQLIVAMSGSFDVVLKDGRGTVRHHLNRSYRGIFVTPMIWRELDNFSSGSVCMVLASNRYDESDYFRDYADYLRAQGLPG
jgi:hypothetical protein